MFYFVKYKDSEWRVCFWLFDSLWSPAGMSKSSSHGATSTGTWPTRASSTWGISCTCPLRLYLPLYAARPALKQPGPAPRVRLPGRLSRAYNHCLETLFCVKDYEYFIQFYDYEYFKTLKIKCWTLSPILFLLSGLEGERPARLARGEGDRDAYRRSAAQRKYIAHFVTVYCGATYLSRRNSNWWHRQELTVLVYYWMYSVLSWLCF